MRMFVRAPVVALIATGLLACGQHRDTALVASAAEDDPSTPLSVPDAGDVVARVNGVEIRQAWLEAIARGRALDLSDPGQRERALDELVEYTVLVSSARDRADLADTRTRADIELNALAGRANALLARLGAAHEPDEAALRAEYEKQKQINGTLEYEVSHLLLPEQGRAVEIALAVERGQDFDVAKAQYSQQAKQAVDLGWIKLGQVPDPFAAALRGLAPGQTTAEPVQTQYGWHVIHLRATRSFQPPDFEQVREGIRRMLLANGTRAAVESLKEQARVEIVEP